MRSCLDEAGPCAHLCSFVLIDRRHTVLWVLDCLRLGVSWVLSVHAFTSLRSCCGCAMVSCLEFLLLRLYLAFKPFAHTCPSKASPPSYWLDVLCITQGGFPWLPHVVPALVPLLWPSLSSPMVIYAPASKGLVGSAPSCVPEFGMVPGLKEELLSSLSFLLIF